MPDCKEVEKTEFEEIETTECLPEGEQEVVEPTLVEGEEPIPEGEAPAVEEVSEAPGDPEGCGADFTKRLDEILEAVNQQGVSLQKLFDRKISYDAQKDKVIENLHRELQQYKDDFYQSLLKPILMDLVMVREDLSKIVRHYTGDETDLSKENMLSLLEGFAQDLGDVMEKYDMEVYSVDSDKFTPIRQRAVKVIKTSDPDLDKTIAERLSSGYSLKDRVVSPEKVIVYAYSASETE